MSKSGHGDDRHKYPGITIKADFSSNVPPIKEHTKLWAHLTERQALIARYPEPEPYTLEREIAQRIGVDPAQVVVTSGATEAIFITAHLLEQSHSGIVQPTFSEYHDAAKLYKHRISPLRSPFDPEDCSVVWLCNPNNPTGLTWDHTSLLDTIRHHRQVTYIIDQSYYAFTPKRVLSGREIAAQENAIGIFSLTKKYAIPGLRLGYIVTHERRAEQLRKVKMPWSVNALAIEAGRYLLQHPESFDLEQLLQERARVVEELDKLGIMDIYPTDTHYFMAKLHSGTAQQLKDHLVKEHGILIRNADNFPTLTPQHIRIAIQTREENNLLIQALCQL